MSPQTRKTLGIAFLLSLALTIGISVTAIFVPSLVKIAYWFLTYGLFAGIAGGINHFRQRQLHADPIPVRFK